VNQSIINCGLMRNVENWLIERSRLNCSSCRPTSKVSEDNPSNVGWEASRHFRNKKREYLKGK
jgi:hypothetical protein